MTSDLRELIREILVEVLESLPERPAAGVRRERAAISCSAELNEFARSLVERAQDADFADAVRDGRLVFELDRPPRPSERPAPLASPTAIVSSRPVEAAALTKPIITERDLAQLGPLQGRLRIGAKSRLTPLAADELKRRGVKLERMHT